MKSNNSDKLWTRDFILLMIVTVFSFLCISVSAPVLPVYVVNEFSSNSTQAGVLASVMIMVALIVRPFAGYAIDRWGRRSLLLGSLLLYALCNFSLMLPNGIGGLFANRILVGFPFAVITTVLGTITTDLAPESRRSEAMSYYVIFSTLISCALGPNLGLEIMGENNYNLAFIYSGIFAVLSFVLCLFMRNRDIVDNTASFSFKTLFEGEVAWLALIQGLCWVGAPGITTFSVLYAGLDGIGGIGAFFLLYGLGMVGSRFLTGITFDKKGPKIAGLLSFCLLFLGYASVGFWKSTAGFLVGGVLLGAGYGLTNATMLAMAMNIVRPERRGVCNATMYFGQDLGVSVGSYLLGFVIDSSGSYNAAYSFAAVFMIIPLALFFLVAFKEYLKKKNLV